MVQSFENKGPLKSGRDGGRAWLKLNELLFGKLHAPSQCRKGKALFARRELVGQVLQIDVNH